MDTIDVEVTGSGTVYAMHPLTEAAHRWLEDNIGPDATWYGDALMVKSRYLDPIIEGMLDDGLEVGRT